MPTVKLYAGLRNSVGGSQVELHAPTLRLVLDGLLERYPAMQQVWDGTRLRLQVVITINGHIVNPKEGLDLPVQPDDRIAIFPPIAGGE